MPNEILLPGYVEYPTGQMTERVAGFHAEMDRRRTVRQFSPRPVPRQVIEAALRAAGTAPSGAHMQPWHFVVVSDVEVKRRIRAAAEEVERAFYESRAQEEWLGALAPLGTTWHKPFLEDAPYLITIFAQRYHLGPDGLPVRHYYVLESVGIATGLLIAALHYAGLAMLTYTPSPMGFLNDILGRPSSEKPTMILAVGHPAEGATVPDLRRKALEEIATFV